ncbi:MAG: AEC family transporter [Candidatus Onthomonas sp.]
MLLIFGKMLTIAILLVLGVVIYRAGIVSVQGSKEISALVIQVCCPLMILYNALEDESIFSLKQLAAILAICAGVYLVLLAAGELLPRLLRVPKEKYPFYTMLSLFGNVGFIGLPVGLSILGSGSMLYIVIFNMMYSVFFYTYGLVTMSRAVGQTIPFQPKALINPGTISCFIALGIYLCRAVHPFEAPALLSDALGYVSCTTTFLAMLVLGVNLATAPLKSILGNLRMYGFVLLRFLGLPCLLAILLGWLMPGEPMLVSTMALMAAMPAGNMSVMLASNYNTETDTLTGGIVLSTLLCTLMIPVVSLFFPG